MLKRRRMRETHRHNPLRRRRLTCAFPMLLLAMSVDQPLRTWTPRRRRTPWWSWHETVPGIQVACSPCHRLIFRGVSGFNAKEDRRHDRRTIGIDELQRLIEAAHNGPPWRNMTGPTLALVYRLAVATGLRYSESQSITPVSFDWKARPAAVGRLGWLHEERRSRLDGPA